METRFAVARAAPNAAAQRAKRCGLRAAFPAPV
jgi:hypothetical protein